MSSRRLHGSHCRLPLLLWERDWSFPRVQLWPSQAASATMTSGRTRPSLQPERNLPNIRTSRETGETARGADEGDSHVDPERGS
jgi:hypothetical protein